MAALKDLTNYSSNIEDYRPGGSTEDNIFVAFNVPPVLSRASFRRRAFTSPRPTLRLENHASNNTIAENTPRSTSIEDLTTYPSILLTPTTPNEEDKPSKFASFNSEPWKPARKKLRLEDNRATKTSPLQATLESLTKTQLVEVINQLLTNRHPELSQEFRELIPEPDLKSMEERLRSLRRNIFKAFPRRTRSVCSSRDAFSFRRVNSQIQAFKKECIAQGHNLVSSGQWRSAAEYALMACSYVEDMPVWESPVHNSSKSRCFNALAIQCNRALSHGKFTVEELQKYEKRLEALLNETFQLEPCLKQVKQHLFDLRKDSLESI